MLHGIFQAFLIGALVVAGMAFLVNTAAGVCKNRKK